MALQILIDIGSDMEVFVRMDEVVKEHVTANPLDFTGESTVHAGMGSDPMKLAMNIWWSYCYNCERQQLSTAYKFVQFQRSLHTVTVFALY